MAPWASPSSVMPLRIETTGITLIHQNELEPIETRSSDAISRHANTTACSVHNARRKSPVRGPSSPTAPITP